MASKVVRVGNPHFEVRSPKKIEQLNESSESFDQSCPNYDNSNGKKTCRICGISHSISDFPHKSKTRTESICKGCYNKARRNRRSAKSETPSQQKKQIKVLWSDQVSPWINLILDEIISNNSETLHQDLEVDSVLGRTKRKLDASLED